MSFKRKTLHQVPYHYQQESIMGNKQSSHNTLAHQTSISTTKRKRSNTQASHHSHLAMQQQQLEAARSKMIPTPPQVIM
jgi:hypothetical protein